MKFTFIEQTEINLLFRMAKFVNSKTTESIQNFISSEKRVGCVVRFFKNGNIVAIWFDAEKLSERDLKFFFKHHKESNKQFFINYLDNFYRIGFKV